MTKSRPETNSDKPAAFGADGSPISKSQVLKRGLFGRCPSCGDGRMFRSFLKVADECPACGEELHHHRADDFPAYIVIAIVGHIVVPLVLGVETRFEPPYWVHFALWPALTAALTLGLLQPVKGAVVALQWSMGMDGFEDAKRRRALTPVPSASSS